MAGMQHTKAAMQEHQVEAGRQQADASWQSRAGNSLQQICNGQAVKDSAKTNPQTKGQACRQATTVAWQAGKQQAEVAWQAGSKQKLHSREAVGNML